MGHELVGCVDQGRGIRRDVGGQSSHHVPEVGARSEVVPLFGIDLVVVELLAAVDVSGVAPTLVADGELSVVVGADRRMIPDCGGVAQEWHQTAAVEARLRRQTGEVDQGRV